MANELTETRYGKPVYETNPYMEEIEQATRSKRITHKTEGFDLVKRETGGIEVEVAGFWTEEEVDAHRFVKLFAEGWREQAKLSKAGTTVLALLFETVQENVGQDRIPLAFALLNKLQKSGISQNTFYKGLNQLIEKDFVRATKAANLFWINPNRMWNGDFLEYTKRYRKRQQQTAPQPDDAQ